MPSSEPSKKLASLLPGIFRLARIAGDLARRFQTIVLWLFLTGFLAAAWLGWSTIVWWDFSPRSAVISGTVLALPSLLLGWCWMVLDSAAEVPQRLEAWLGKAREYAGDLRQRFQPEDTDTAPVARSRFSDLRRLAGLALELQFLGSDASELLGILGGALTLSNPLFLFALAGAAALVGLLDCITLIAALVF